MIATSTCRQDIALFDGRKIVADEEEGCRSAPRPSISLSRRWRCNPVSGLPGTLIQIRRALKPDGLFLAGLLGGETLIELRDSFFAAESEIDGGASPQVAPFIDVREAGALLQRAGFALPVDGH